MGKTTENKQVGVEKVQQLGGGLKGVDLSSLDPNVAAIIAALTDSVMSIRGAVSKIQGDVTDMKEEKKAALAARRAEGPIGEGVPEKIAAAVREILGDEFGMEVSNSPDRPGYYLHIVVPEKYMKEKTTATKDELARKKELDELLNPHVKSSLTKKEKAELYSELMEINNKIAPRDVRSCFIPYSESEPKAKEWALRIKANVAQYIMKEGPKL